MALVTETPPDTEPVSLAEAKAHLRVDHGADDALILSLIAAARGLAEARTDRRFISTALCLYLDSFPCRSGGLIELPGGTVTAVASVKYRDPDGTLVTMDTADWQADLHTVPSRLFPAYGTSWPSTKDVPNAVEIRYTAGYGAASSAVPAHLRSAVKLILGHLYENREAVNIGNITNELPFGVEALISPERVHWL